MFKRNSRIHFIAIGGSIMHSLAICLRKMDYKVTGSDDEIFDPAKSRLEAYGLLPGKFGWFPDKIDTSLDIIILGMHAKSDNPELLRAKELGMKIYSFPEILYRFSENKTRIVIAGSHGKTTITSMLMHAFKQNGLQFDYAVGASLKGFDQMVSLSHDNPYILIEGDEYLSSALDLRSKFLHYKPQHAIISGIEWDHINVFPEFSGYLDTFKKFIQTIDKEGTLVYYADDKNLKKVVSESDLPVHVAKYECPEFRINEDGTTQIHIDNEEYSVDVIGKHNYTNMLGASYLWVAAGFAKVKFWKAMESFELPGLRLEYWKKNSKNVVIRDFAHAPSKVFASVHAVREHYKNSFFTAILELHTYSSLTPEFIKNYHGAFNDTDKCIVFLDRHALTLKDKEIPEKQFLKEAFGEDNLIIIENAEQLKSELLSKNTGKTVSLLMSSGKLGGLKKEHLN